MRIDRFHETWNGGLTVYTHYCNTYAVVKPWTSARLPSD
jgi:hypothetical protein